MFENLKHFSGKSKSTQKHLSFFCSNIFGIFIPGISLKKGGAIIFQEITPLFK